MALESTNNLTDGLMNYAHTEEKSRFAWYEGDVVFLDDAPKPEEEKPATPPKKRKAGVIVVRRHPQQ